MSFEMQSQMIGPRKGTVAHSTLKGTVTGMFSHMSRQFVGSGELPSAIFPIANVRLLAGVRPEVSFQMARLCVTLAAARMFARMRRQLAL